MELGLWGTGRPWPWRAAGAARAVPAGGAGTCVAKQSVAANGQLAWGVLCKVCMRLHCDAHRRVVHECWCNSTGMNVT